jgi:hypothetical protein
MALGPSEWGYVGVQGYYQGMANHQNALQNASSNLGLSGLLGGANMVNQYAQQMQAQYYPYPQAVVSSATIESLFGGVAQAPIKVKARAKRLIDRLRAEIEEWHGDVLCRLEAA